MASKVNTKFVAVLVGALVLLAGGVAVTASLVLNRSAADLASQGDAFAKAGNIVEAEKAYSKAVAKERTNVEYLRKWRDSLDQLVLPSQTLFDTKFPQYVQVRRAIADLLRTDVDAHRDHLEYYLSLLEEAGYNRGTAEMLAQRTTDALAQFGETPEAQQPAQALRRYRGLANIRIMLAARNLRPQEEEAVREDLEAAIAADPSDVDSVIALQEWHLFRADVAMRGERPDEAEKLAEKGRGLVREFRAKNPGEPRAMLTELGYVLTDARRRASVVTRPEDRQKIVDQLRKEGAAGLEATAAALGSIDPAKLRASDLAQFASLELQLDDSGKLTRSLGLIERAVAAQPQNASLLMAKGTAEELARRYDDSIASFEKVLSLPNQPLGIQGRLLWLRRNEAVFRQAAVAMRAYEMTTDPDPAKEKTLKAEWLERGKAKRNALAKLEPDGSPRMMLIDGKIRLAEENFPEAQRLLLAYLSATNESDADALFAAARASIRLNQPGRTRELLEKSLAINTLNVGAMLMLGEVEIRFRNFERARELYASAASLLPDNEQIKARLNLIDQQRGQAEITDPVDRVLADAQAKQNAGEDAAAREVLEKGAEANAFNPRLVLPLVSLRMGANDIEGAKSMLNRAIAGTTDAQAKQIFERSLKVLEVGDPVEAQVLSIRQSEQPEVEKALGIYAAYAAGGEKFADAAKSAAAELESKYPDEPRVIEALFIRALRERDVPTARKWSEKAVARNLDQYEGASFKARLLTLEQRRPEAITLMEAAAQRHNFNVEAWRILSALQAEEGRFADAQASMKKALDIRPDDVTSVLQYSAVLQAGGQNEEALRLMRDSRAIAGESMQIRDEWIRLEATVGDKELALRERERDLARDPNNRTYQLQVAGLSTEVRRFDQARKRIDTLRASSDGLDAAQLDALWHADQGDLASAEKVLRDYASKLKAEKPGSEAETLLTLGRFLASRGQSAGAIRALEEARPVQDPKALPADRLLVELFIDAGQTDRAIEALQRMVQAMAPNVDDAIRLRLAESLVTARRFDEALKELDQLSPTMRDSVAPAILRADAAAGRGDSKLAMELLDKAVTTFPNNAAVFLKRAQAAIEQERNTADILADLEQALRLDPRLWQAHQLRAYVYDRANRPGEVINEIRSILRINPEANDMLGMGIRMLLEQDRDDEAVALAEDVSRRRPSSGTLQADLGDLFESLRRPRLALGFYKNAATLDSRTPLIVRYVNALLKSTPPNLTEAEQTLTRVQDRIARDPELLLARAALRRARGSVPDARRDAVQSIRLIPVDQAGPLQGWFASALRLLGPTDLATILDGMAREGANADWIGFFRARLQADNATTRSAGLDEMNRIARSTSIAPLAALAIREWSGRLYLAREFEKAEKAMREIIATDPQDAETLNNLAYVLGKDLNRPDEALEFAKKASELRPNSAETLDTYGMVLMQSGKLEEADRVLSRALATRSQISTQVTILLHIAELKHKQGKTEEARATLARAKSLLAQSGGVTQEFQKDEAARLEKLIGGS